MANVAVLLFCNPWYYLKYLSFWEGTIEWRCSIPIAIDLALLSQVRYVGEVLSDIESVSSEHQPQNLRGSVSHRACRFVLTYLEFLPFLLRMIVCVSCARSIALVDTPLGILGFAAGARLEKYWWFLPLQGVQILNPILYIFWWIVRWCKCYYLTKKLPYSRCRVHNILLSFSLLSIALFQVVLILVGILWYMLGKNYDVGPWGMMDNVLDNMLLPDGAALVTGALFDEQSQSTSGAVLTALLLTFCYNCQLPVRNNLGSWIGSVVVPDRRPAGSLADPVFRRPEGFAFAGASNIGVAQPVVTRAVSEPVMLVSPRAVGAASRPGGSAKVGASRRPASSANAALDPNLSILSAAPHDMPIAGSSRSRPDQQTSRISSASELSTHAMAGSPACDCLRIDRPSASNSTARSGSRSEVSRDIPIVAPSCSPPGSWRISQPVTVDGATTLTLSGLRLLAHVALCHHRGSEEIALDTNQGPPGVEDDVDFSSINLVEAVIDDAMDLHAMVLTLRLPDTLHEIGVVSFRGTSNMQNLSLDFQARIVPVEASWMLSLAEENGISNVKAHNGFLAAFMSIRGPLIEAVQKLHVPFIWCVGHSLGGALATLAAAELHLATASNVQIGLCNFGSPRVGNAAFVRLVSCATSACVRVVHSNDPVARIPPRHTNCTCRSDDLFEHVSGLVRVFSNGHIIVMPTFLEEVLRKIVRRQFMLCKAPFMILIWLMRVPNHRLYNYLGPLRTVQELEGPINCVVGSKF